MIKSALLRGVYDEADYRLERRYHRAMKGYDFDFDDACKPVYKRWLKGKWYAREVREGDVCAW